MAAREDPVVGEFSDARLAAIVECSTDAIVGLTPEGCITSWNAAAERLYLYTAEEVLTRHVGLIIPPERRAEFDGLMARTLAGELIQGFETLRQRKDGSTVEVSISKSTISGPDGSVAGVASITRDISAIRDAEHTRMRYALEHAARAEAESGAWRASVLAGVSRVLAENFIDHRPMLDQVARMTAIAMETACVIELFPDEHGASIEPCAIDHADEDVRAELSRVLSAPHQRDDSPWRDLDRAFLADHPLRDSLSVPMLAFLEPVGVLSLGRFGSDAQAFTDHDREFTDDLAMRVGLAVENVRLYERAKRAIEMRDTFLTIAAHELKTPLTSIHGYAQLLTIQLAQGSGLESDPARRSARLIEERTRHLTRLVEQILDVSRLDVSRLTLNLQATDLACLVHSVVAEFTRRNARNVVLHAPGQVWAAVDPVRIAQVVSNLLDNAVRYSPDGGQIEIQVRSADSEWKMISVRDRGIGIAEVHRAHLFDRFYQAHGVNYRSGMGLGLHISREVVVLHGGEITATFPASGGSLFKVRLPRGSVEGMSDNESSRE